MDGGTDLMPAERADWLLFIYMNNQRGWGMFPEYNSSLSPGWQQRESLAGAWGVIHKCSSYRSGPRDQALHCPGCWWAVIWGDWAKNEDRLMQYWRSVIAILITVILWRMLLIIFSFCQVGDIVSVIDMPPKEDTTWWRGKHGFQVCYMWFSPLI